ncbi:LiaI-LiaF-like domain-containing protein [Frateuria aurantia]
MRPSAAGIVLVVVGILFLLRNFGFDLHIGRLLTTWWPLILIVVGISMLFRDRSPRG